VLLSPPFPCGFDFAFGGAAVPGRWAVGQASLPALTGGHGGPPHQGRPIEPKTAIRRFPMLMFLIEFLVLGVLANLVAHALIVTLA
jgi:hypothetical protein